MVCQIRASRPHMNRVISSALALAVLTFGLAPALSASEVSEGPVPSFSTRSIAKVIEHATPETARMSRSAAPATPKATPTQATKSGSFFKTRTGLLVIAIMAVGTGYAVYSAKEDRIRGSVR